MNERAPVDEVQMPPSTTDQLRDLIAENRRLAAAVRAALAVADEWEGRGAGTGGWYDEHYRSMADRLRYTLAAALEGPPTPDDEALREAAAATDEDAEKWQRVEAIMDQLPGDAAWRIRQVIDDEDRS